MIRNPGSVPAINRKKNRGFYGTNRVLQKSLFMKGETTMDKELENNTNNGTEMTGEETNPQTTEKKKNVVVRLFECGHRKILQFRATKAGRIVHGVVRVGEGGLALYGLHELLFSKKQEPVEAIVTSGEVVEENEESIPEEEPEMTEDINEEHD